MESQLTVQGMLRDCAGLEVFQAGRVALRPGQRLRRYYMRQFAELIGQARVALERGPDALSRYLGAVEWQTRELACDDPKVRSGDIKMLIVLEALFEQARAGVAPAFPSRLDCTFTWASLDHARHYGSEYVRGGMLHRCRVIEGAGFERDGALLPPGIKLSNLARAALAEQVQTTQARAERYWSAREPPLLPELMIAGSVEVLEVVEGL
jgi:hypothetical protein